MYFTKEDYKKIENWLRQRSVKDTEFPVSNYAKGDETVPIIQDGINKVIGIDHFVKQLATLNPLYYYNVTEASDILGVTLEDAIGLVPCKIRRRGLTITFLDKEFKWRVYQFIGNYTEEWCSVELWKNTEQELKDSIQEIENALRAEMKNRGDAIQFVSEKIDDMKKDVEDNYPKLDNGLIPSSYLPSYVDDVLEYDDFLSFPKPGESGKIYVSTDTNLTYRWSGTDYVEISKSIGLGETSSTAYPGDKGKELNNKINEVNDSITKLSTRVDGVTKPGIWVNGNESVVYPSEEDGQFRFSGEGGILIHQQGLNQIQFWLDKEVVPDGSFSVLNLKNNVGDTIYTVKSKDTNFNLNIYCKDGIKAIHTSGGFNEGIEFKIDPDTMPVIAPSFSTNRTGELTIAVNGNNKDIEYVFVTSPITGALKHLNINISAEGWETGVTKQLIIQTAGDMASPIITEVTDNKSVYAANLPDSIEYQTLYGFKITSLGEIFIVDTETYTKN